MRKALTKIKRNAEKYVASASDASSALADLTDNLDVLRALDIFRAE